MKQEAHIFQGMKRDNHPTLQQASFLWDALNIRINRKDGDTYLAITNERGNKDTGINIEGDYVGHCALDKYLVIFTVKDNNSYIYRVQRDDNTYTTILLYKGALGFSQDYPIEALGVMETNLLYKVYWIDGNHQPRFIIITTPEYNNVDIIDGKDCTSLYNENLFDFVGKLQLDEEVTITKNYGSGIFSPGVIQYAFTYFNKYGQESNIFYTTPLQYISFSDRAGNPEDRIACSFKIDISKLDKNFNYLRVYSIHRTSIDAVPTVLQLPDIEIDKTETETETETSVSITDTGNIGTTVDPTKLLYIGGREFIPQTFAAKDGTLFFGDIKLIAKDTQVLEELNTLNIDSIIQNVDAITRQWEYSPATFYIEEKNRLDNGYNALFKTNETYRIGIQAQLSNGTWSQPVFIADKILNTLYPYVEITDTPSLISNIYTIKQYTGAINIPKSIIDSLKGKGVKKLRACVVFPATYEREVICQGVINPTVYNAYLRSENAPFTQSSWFFRPTVIDASKGLKDSLGKNIQHTHNKPLGASVNSASGYTKEIQSMFDNTPLDKITSPKQKNSNFYIDENIVTFHSPDIEFDDNTWQLDYRGCKLKVLGYVELNSIYGDVNITTSTPTRGNKSNGFVHSIVGYNGKMPIRNRNNGGMVSHPLYYDTAVNENGEIIDKYYGYTIYPWHRGTSLNNDIANTADDKRVRSAMLKTKVMSNLKFFNKYTPINHFNGSETSVMDIETPQLFNSEETTILKQDIDYLHPGGDDLGALSGVYWGNVDSLIAPSTEYKIDPASLPASKDPIRIKYKSTPHLMFKFKQPVKEGGYPVQVLIPRHVDAPDPGTGIDYPKWIIDGDPYDGISDDVIMEGNPSYKGTIDVIGVRIYTNQSSGDLYNAYNYTNKTCYGLLNDGTTPFLGKVSWNNETHIYDFTPVEAGIYKIEGPPTLIYLLKTIDSEEDKGIFPIDRFFSPEEYSVIEDQDEYGNTVTRYEVLITNTQKNYVQWDGDNLLPSQRPSYAPSIKTSTSSTGTIRVEYSQPTFGIKGEGSNIAPYLLLVELTKEIDNKYGGESPDILQSHMWIPASDAVTLDSLVNKDGTTKPIKLIYGDTWFDRYDCLKTYPFTREDQNQVVEIGSFMCETRVNLNGRYDRNKGELSCLQMSPANFNLLNKVYNQKDNFFNYKILDKDSNRLNHFPYQFTWSLQKINGDSTDAWTNISLANVSDMDGAYGKLTKLVTFNDALFAFQEKALSAIAFNSRVQIPTSDGVPIEISNSYKVDGSKLINSYIGCYDKWAIESSPYGVYFFDKYSQSLYLYNGELTNLSDTLGMKHWVSLLNKDSVWKPKSSVSNGIRIFYDPNYKDVYFTPGPGSDIPALCYSEELKQFSSLLSYNGTEAMFPWEGNFYSLHKSEGTLRLWHNFVGEYNYIYDNFNPYYISFISNENPLITKIFDTVEYQAGLYQDSTELYDKPFNKVEAFNEYQESSAVLDNMNTRKKFRIWRTNIPRSSKVASRTSTTGNIDRNRFGRARMRNPWVNIKLTHNNKDTAKLVLNSVVVNYSI